jgi:hypothetical protein
VSLIEFQYLRKHISYIVERYLAVNIPQFPYGIRSTTKTIQSLHRDELTGIEIGTEYGYNAFNMFKNLPIKKLYCIDPYEVDDKILVKAKKRLAPYKDKIEFIRKRSCDAYQDVPDVDFVYIDGDHSYSVVKSDIELYYPKARLIVGGHDVYSDEVQKAVLEYMKEKDIPAKNVYFALRDWIIVKGDNNE